MKEIQLSLNISDYDLNTKLNKTLKLLAKKHQIYVTLQLKGSSMVFEYALAKSEYWTKVKQFKNGGSGNVIKVWLSNNK